MIPAFFPIFDPRSSHLADGTAVQACAFCKKAIKDKPQCLEHYKSLLNKNDGYYQCPFGLTTHVFYFQGLPWFVTGVIAFPRFNTEAEKDLAKRFPSVKVARTDIDGYVQVFRQLDIARADVIQEAAKVFPQAFHELRKLNGAVLQYAEKEAKEGGESKNLHSIRSAAELMRNNFNILEALSNIEGMRTLPIDSTVNLYDITYKNLRVLDERAAAKQMEIKLDGIRAIIRGNQKSFPVVPAVLLENAIKYGKEGTVVRAHVLEKSRKAILTVENESVFHIDCTKCFERGSRYASGIEGGGFGLFLAKEIVSCHNGTIWCSAKGGKVIMTVELPLKEVMKDKLW